VRSRVPPILAPPSEPPHGRQRLLATLDVQPLIGAARSAYLPYGTAVVYRACPQVSDQDENRAPGDGENRTGAADRSSQQQPPQRVDGGREGLVLGEPAYPGWHRVWADKRTAGLHRLSYILSALCHKDVLKVSIKSRDGVNSFPRILPSFHTRFLYALIAKM
jgi:hypothetical protein